MRSTACGECDQSGGPAGQPTKYAVVVSNPGPGLLGLVTFVDFAGDTVLSTPSILTNPSYFQITSDGTEGFVVNPLGSLNAFGAGQSDEPADEGCGAGDASGGD